MTGDSAAAPRLHIAFHLDVVCPWCWIGTRNLRRAIQDLHKLLPTVAIRLAWHAESLLPQIPDQGVDFKAFYLARLGSAEAVAARRAQVNALARTVGLQIDFDAITTFPNSRGACELINSAQALLTTDQMFELVESIYAAFFVQNLNIGRPDVLHQLAQAAGVPTDLAPWSAPLHPAHAPANGVPHFVFNSQQALTGTVPATDLLQAMARAVAATPRRVASGS